MDFESALEFTGLGKMAHYSIEQKWKNVDLTPQQIAGLKLEYCIKAINEGWRPDWSNKNQYKYYNWFEFKNGGWFLFSAGGGDFTYSICGFAFYYQTKEKAEFGAKNFMQYYKIWLG